MSSDKENEYFCDGITEEIINALAKVGSLKVTSRTSSFHFKDRELPITDIANTLGVTNVLEGSVRLSGRVVRITAQLIEAKEDFHYWSETWDRTLEDIFEVQDEISLLIADKIRENFGHFEIQDHLVYKQTSNVNAYEHALLANYHKNKWNPEDARVAEEHYQKGLELDPNHVDSIVGLADIYSFYGMVGAMPFEESWTKCNSLLDQAAKLDPNNPQVFYQKGHSAFFTECNFSKALELGNQAIQQKPNYVEAQQFLSFLHVLSGNIDLSKKHLDIALGIDPLSEETLFFKAYFDYMTGDFVTAYEELNKRINANPKNIPAHAVMTLCLLKLGRPDEVISYFDDLEVELPQGERIGALALAYDLKGDYKNSDKYREQLETLAKTPDGFAADSFVFVHKVVRGKLDLAFDWVEKGIISKSSLLLLRYQDPIVDGLKSDARYEQFRKKLYGTNKVSARQEKKALMDDESAETFTRKLLNKLEQEEVYLDSDLNLRSLANQINIHPNQLSWLLNSRIGKSFNEFVNGYRIQHFKKLAANPNNSNLTLLGMAFDSGFNSKTVFNTYFKKETGQTPKQFLKAQA